MEDIKSNNNTQTSHSTLPEAKRKKSSLAAGIIITVFAVIGIIGVISFAVREINSYYADKKQEKLNAYNSYLIPAAAIDIMPFDDITGAQMSELVEMSVWSIISGSPEPNTYEYKSGSLVIPASSVEAAFTEFFGTQLTIEHTTVQGYGYEFTYNSTENAYYIPITSITPLYTPTVTDIDKKGNAVTVTCGLINADRWMQDKETGSISSPEPDKYIKVTFRNENGNTFISAVRSLSAPETASTAASSQENTSAESSTALLDALNSTDIISTENSLENSSAQSTSPEQTEAQQ